MPKQKTHDFPKPLHIVPSGYLILKKKQSQLEYEFDFLKRKHVVYPRTGELYLFNRADFFHSSTIESHMHDLEKIMKDQTIKVLIYSIFFLNII